MQKGHIHEQEQNNFWHKHSQPISSFTYSITLSPSPSHSLFIYVYIDFVPVWNAPSCHFCFSQTAIRWNACVFNVECSKFGKLFSIRKSYTIYQMQSVHCPYGEYTHTHTHSRRQRMGENVKCECREMGSHTQSESI